MSHTTPRERHETKEHAVRRAEKAHLARLLDRERERSYREHLAMMDADEPIWGLVAAVEQEQRA